MVGSHLLSRAWRRLRGLSLRFDWLVWLTAAVVIGQEYSGFSLVHWGENRYELARGWIY